MSDYVELRTRSCYSFLNGASKPEALVRRAFEVKMPALGLTDHNGIYGVMPFIQAAKSCGIKPILGTELTLEGGASLTLLVENATGWFNLCWLTSKAQQNAPKGEAALPFELLAGHTDGLIALSGGKNGEVNQALLRADFSATAIASRYRELFGTDHFWIELQHHFLREDNRLVRRLVALSKRLGVGYVATNDVYYATPQGRDLHDILVCIRNGVTWENAGLLLRPNAEYYLKSAEEMSRPFAELPEALSNTLLIAEQCNFEPRYGIQDLPQFPTPGGLSADEYLRQLVTDPERFPDTSQDEQERLDNELAIIARKGLSNYFLIVWDIVQFARRQNMFVQGRGSACSSLTGYRLGISPLHPMHHGLVFERFLSDERESGADIDIDFPSGEAREQVIQYVFNRYGIDHAAMACTFSTFKARSALREVAKALGFPKETINRAARVLDVHGAKQIRNSSALKEYLGTQHSSVPWQRLFSLCEQIAGFPRHVGLHNGGFIITGSPLAERVPVEPARMKDRFVVQMDKYALEAVGFIKIDVLGLRIMSAIREAVRIIEESTGIHIDLDSIPLDDPKVYDLVCSAQTIGIFQLESRPLMGILPLMKPRDFKAIRIAVSVIRPGPIQGQMVHPLMRRIRGLERVTFLHPLLEPILKDTYGVVLYHEDVLQMAHVLAGFSLGKAEQFRRVLGTQDEEKIRPWEVAFMQGTQRKGISLAVAQAAFAQVRGFGGYSFPRSHSGALARLALICAWLKLYYSAPFLIGLLNNQPMGYYAPATLINEAKRLGIAVLPPRLGVSQAKCTLEDGKIRLGFEYVARMGKAQAKSVEKAQADGPFTGLADFYRRTQLPKNVVLNMILAGVMDEWGIERRELLWELGLLPASPDELPLNFNNEKVLLTPLTPQERETWERIILRVTTGNHLMMYLRSKLEALKIIGSAALEQCPDEAEVQVAGVAILHNAPPTAKGFHFVTLEDEFFYFMNVIVRPDIYITYRNVFRDAPMSMILVKGKVQREESVVNVIATHVEPLLPALAA